jgi:hypothetical protein
MDDTELPKSPEDAEDTLLRVFHYYALQGQASDVETMTAHQFVRFLQDCGILRSSVMAASQDMGPAGRKKESRRVLVLCVTCHCSQ